VEPHHLALLPALARAVLAAAEHEDQAVVALQVREPMALAVLVGELEVGQHHAGLEVLAHRCSFSVRWNLAHHGRTPGTRIRSR
jgi:hypothetical protein